MKRLLTTAACCGVLFGSTASAQDVVNNTLSRVGQAVSNTAGQAQGVSRNVRHAVRNQVGNTVSGATSSVNQIGGNVMPHAGSHSQHRVGVHGNVHASQGHIGYGHNGYGHRGHVHHGQAYGGQVDGSYNNNSGYQHGNSGYAVGHHGHHMSGHHGHHMSGYHATMPQSGYSSQGFGNSGAVYTLQHDSSGREFICVNGSPVYFDSVNAQGSVHQDGTEQGERYQAGYGGYDDPADSQATDDPNSQFEAPAAPSAAQQDAGQAQPDQAAAEAEADRAVDRTEQAVDQQEAPAPETPADAQPQDLGEAVESATE